MPARASEGKWRRIGGAPTRSLAEITISMRFCSVHLERFPAGLRHHARDDSSRGSRYQPAHAERNQTHGLKPLSLSDRHRALAHKATRNDVAKTHEFIRCHIRTPRKVIHLRSCQTAHATGDAHEAL